MMIRSRGLLTLAGSVLILLFSGSVEKSSALFSAPLQPSSISHSAVHMATTDPQITSPRTGRLPPAAGTDIEAAKALLASSDADDYARGISLLAKLADQGDRNAALSLGLAYIWPERVKGHAREGIELLDHLGATGLSVAFAELGQVFLWGNAEVEADPARALGYLESAADAGDPKGIRLLGEHLMTGWVLRADPKRGRALLEGLVGQGDVLAKLALGRALLDQSSSSRIVSRAIQLLEEAGTAGESDGYQYLGEAYLWGKPGLKVNGEQSMAYLEKAASAGNRKAQITLAEQLVSGRVFPVDLPRAKQILSRLIEEGDTQAKVVLGRALVFSAVEQDAAREGLALLEDAASADPELWSEIADIYIWGTSAVKADPQLAQPYLERGIAAGNVNAERTLGKQLITGWVLPRDTERGMAILERLVARNDIPSLSILGDLLLFGTGLEPDRDRGLALLKTAADKGDLEAFEILGRHYMWTAKTQEQRQLALAYLTKAANGDLKRSWLTLAEGATFDKLGKQASSQYKEYERQARKAGIEQIDVLSAQRFLWGLGERYNVDEGIRRLDSAAREGNKAALLYRLSLLRDGYGKAVKPSKRAAREYLKSMGARLPEGLRKQEQLLIEAARTGTNAVDQLAQEIIDNKVLDTTEFHRRILQVNPNLSVYMAQKRLYEMGRYNGTLNGLATKATISAIKDLCADARVTRKCSGPTLGPGVVALIASGAVTVTAE